MYLLPLFFLNLLSFVTVVSATCVGDLSQSEVNSLQSLFNSTDGPHWLWDSSRPLSTHWSFPVSSLDVPCVDAWQGVTCSSSLLGGPSCVVKELRLSRMNLAGSIPSTLGSLASMTVLSLYSNNLTGSIPSELGELILITELDLYTNKLTGSIPSELGYLTSITALGLNTNSLTGCIPSQLGELTSMTVLYLYSNCFTGSIPSELGGLASMTVLALYFNSLTGSIPSELGRLTLLTELSLYFNSLKGSIPSELGELVSLTAAYLYSSGLTGTIPSELGGLTSMTLLLLYSNSLTGSIPSELGQLVNMTELSLYSNSLSGSIPSELGRLVSMTVLYLYSNSLTGCIPSELGQLSSMTLLDFNTNRLTGFIPSELGGLESITVLYLYSNSLSGSIPAQILNLTSLSAIDLIENMLSGGLGIISPNLQVISLSSNVLSGALESSVNSQLLSFNVSDNAFSSSIPSSLCQNSLLQSIDLSSNRLTGTLPSCLYFSISLEQLIASNNHLSGSLELLNPRLNDSSSALTVLDLSFNDMTGTLPTFLFGLSSLQSLILSSNCFHGSLPDSMCMAQNITELILDGLSSSSACSVDSLKPVLRGVFPKWYISGGIPGCVWQSMPQLTTLHLSGNGLGGSLGSLSSQSLADVNLAHNRLTGTIPGSFQRYGRFTKLDLSSNRLGGTLSSAFVLSPSQAFLNVSLNRLSGEIPESFVSAAGMSVVEGNMFACAGGVLPSSDNQGSKYTCGSKALNDAMYAWLCGSGCLCIVVVLLLLTGMKQVPSLSGLDACLTGLVSSNIRLVVLMSLLSSIVYVSLKLGPWQSLYSTHTYQYGWVDSAVYLRGWVPACLVVLMLAISVFISYIPLLRLSRSNASGRFSSSNNSSNSNSNSHSHSNSNSNRIRETKSSDWVKIVPLYLVNLTVVLVVNVVYIYFSLGRISANQLLVVQFVLSMFKVGWKSVAIPGLVRWSGCSLFHHIALVVVSYVLGPIISAFFSQSSCFLYALTGQPAIQSTYGLDQFACTPLLYTICVDGSCHTIIKEDCSFKEVAPVSISLSAGWIYSYQCSSALLIDYVPVFILTCLLNSVLVPACVWMWSRLGLPMWTASREMRIELAVIKMVLNLTLLLTFGLADPLLCIPVGLECGVLVWRQLTLSDSDSEAPFDASEVSREVGYAMKSVLYLICLVLGLFWSLFMLDMMGVEFGGFVGGCSMVVPLVVVYVLMEILARRVKHVEVLEGGLSDLAGSLSMSPIHYPTDINRDF